MIFFLKKKNGFLQINSKYIVMYHVFFDLLYIV